LNYAPSEIVMLWFTSNVLKNKTPVGSVQPAHCEGILPKLDNKGMCFLIQCYSDQIRNFLAHPRYFRKLEETIEEHDNATGEKQDPPDWPHEPASGSRSRCMLKLGQD